MKKLKILLLCFLSSLSLYSQTPTIRSVIDQVNLDSLTYFVEQLSGEVPVVINGTLDTIVSRHKFQTGNDKAADLIKQKLQSYGLNVYDQIFSATGRNVYAVQTGTKYPNQKYIICAHYDDMPSGPIAPGADDNASGTAAVLEAARLLSNYTFPYTIVYALWDEEEQGLVGSKYYANDARNQNDSILGVINLDMIAYDSDSNYVADIHTNEFESSQDLMNKMIDIKNIYELDINFNIIDPGKPWSDHKSFWDKNYGAILLIEDYNDFNEFYHKVTDKISEFNMNYFHKMSKLAISTLALFVADYNIKIKHTQLASRSDTNDIQISAVFLTSLDIGTGINSPRLYYKAFTNTSLVDFKEIIGQMVSGDTLYNFTIPGQPLGTTVQYYLAAQDEDSVFVTTLPNGGYGFSPPGKNPPSRLYEFYIGQSQIVFEDSLSNLNNWITTGDWGLTTSKFVSSPYSLSDSPYSNYQNNTNSYCVLKDTIDLNIENCFKVLLEFNTQWVIEDNYDYGQILVSSNGGSFWIPLEGEYTNEGTVNQAYEEPLYDGGRYNWVNERIDLSRFIGQKIKLKFLIVSDETINFDGWYIDDIKVTAYTSTATDIQTQNNIPLCYTLNQNYPNPFNPSTVISYQLPVNSMVQIKIYNVLGQEIATLVNEEKPAGKHKVEFNASNLSSGVYIYQISVNDFIDVKKMILMK
ncbi:MAG: M28 family peptidase [Ignavibacteriales bacterium]|nr:M28 family peptidase [Ignavibacteriales bacterium]